MPGITTSVATANRASEVSQTSDRGLIRMLITPNGTTSIVPALYRRDQQKFVKALGDVSYSNELIEDGSTLANLPVAPGSLRVTSTGITDLIDKSGDGILKMDRVAGSLLASGTDGVSSVIATHTLTSATAGFVAAGVVAGDTVVIPSGHEVGTYTISGVTATVLTLVENFPVGGQTHLTYKVFASDLNCGTVNYFTGLVDLNYPSSPSSAYPEPRGTVLGTSTFTVNLDPSMTLGVDIDAGGAATATFTATAATRSGVGGTFAASASESLVLEANSSGDQTILFGAGTETTVDTYVDALNVMLTECYAIKNTNSLNAMISLSNDIKAKYNAHRVLTSSHPHADSTNSVSTADATDLATAETLANKIKEKLNLHYISLSLLEECITLVNELQIKYAAHRILTAGGVHANADGTNIVLSPAATDLTSARTLANDIKAMYNLHIVLTAGPVHGLADGTNGVTAADATNLSTLAALVNQIKSKFNAHIILTTGSVHGAADGTNTSTANDSGTADIHLNDDITHTISSPDANSLATLVTLVTELKSKYNLHLADTTSHSAADTADVESLLTDTIDIVSERKGSSSKIQVKSGTGTILTKLGFSAGSSSSTGSNVSNINAVTFAELKTITELAVTGCTVTQDASGKPRMSSSSVNTGASSKIQVSGTARTKFGFDASLHLGSDADAQIPVYANYVKTTLITGKQIISSTNTGELSLLMAGNNASITVDVSSVKQK